MGAVTAPIWMALSPEVHSALLSSGPGPGSLLAASSIFIVQIGIEYTWEILHVTYLLGPCYCAGAGLLRGGAEQKFILILQYH